MNTALLCISIFAAICAWGFLLAGALTFHDRDRPEIRGWGFLLFVLDIFISLGMLTMCYVIVRNWRRRPEARRLLYLGFSCLGVAFTLGVVCLFASACFPGPAAITRYDKPLTYAQATEKKDIDFPLPPSSHNIYYGFFADWQAYTLIVRFDAPVQDCSNHINTVLAWDDKIYNRTSSYPRVPVGNVEPVSAGFLAPATWFTPEKIKHGIYAGRGGSHTPEIWVDLDRGTFYFMETD